MTKEEKGGVQREWEKTDQTEEMQLDRERGLGEEEQQGETQKEKYRLGGKAEQEAWAAEVPPHSCSSAKQ